MAIKITSAAFKEGEPIPAQNTCDGKNLSPALSWSGIPVGTKSLALICDDPDAPSGTWVHWVMYNIPPEITELSEGVPNNKVLPNKAIQGINDSSKLGYSGPCPPGGTHRYFFKIYALKCLLSLEPGASKKELVKTMEGHILDQGQLMGKYSRKE